MGTTPDQLRQDIERTRAELTNRVDTLAEKVSPSAVAHRRADDAKGMLAGVRDKVMGGKDTMTDPLGGSTSSISDRASGIGDMVSERAGSLSDRAADLGSVVSDHASSMTDSLTATPQAVRSKAQGAPLAAGVIAFGAGLLISSLLPATDKEQHAAIALKEKAEPVVDRAKSEAKEQAQQLKESVQPAAQQAVEQVKSTAQDAVQTTKEQAQSSAGEVADHAKGAAQDTRDEVADHAAQAKNELGSESSAGSSAGATVYPSEPLIETPAPSHPNF